MPILARGIEPQILRALKLYPVVVLEGGRAVGKSTLCRELARQRAWGPIVDLSEPGVREQMHFDPIRYVRDLATPAIIDEAQLEPQLPLWIKRVVDERDGRAGQFLLTGSARLGRAQLGGSDPLAGRAARFRMGPLTEAEKAGKPAMVAARLFQSPFVPGTQSPRERVQRDPVDENRWLRGGLPAIPGVLADSTAATWERAMASYIEAVIPLGTGSSRVDQSRVLRAFRYLAANPGQQLNYTRMASELSIKADTARAYVDHLEAAFLLFRAEAHRPSEHKVLTSHPRVFATDTGLAAWAMRIVEAPPAPLARGALAENRLALALATTAEWSEERIALRHWRDSRSKREVDLLLVHPNGRAIAVEVKSASSVGSGDTLGIQAFAAENADAFQGGFVVYDGSRVIDLSPQDLPSRSLLAVPVDLFLE